MINTVVILLYHCLIHLGSYRSSDGQLLGLLGVTVFPLRTLDTFAAIAQSRKFTIGAIGARYGVGILCGQKIKICGQLHGPKVRHTL